MVPTTFDSAGELVVAWDGISEFGRELFAEIHARHARPSVTDEVISFTQWCQKTGAEPGQQTQWVTRQPAGSELAAHLEIADTDQVVSVLRLRLMDGEPAMVERLNYPLDVGKHILTFDTDSGSIYRHLLDGGVDIAYATRTIDAVPANEEDAALLKVRVGAPLLRVRRRAFTLDGAPIEASDDRYLASKANFSVTTARGNASPISLQAGEGVR